MTAPPSPIIKAATPNQSPANPSNTLLPPPLGLDDLGQPALAKGRAQGSPNKGTKKRGKGKKARSGGNDGGRDTSSSADEMKPSSEPVREQRATAATGNNKPPKLGQPGNQAFTGVVVERAETEEVTQPTEPTKKQSRFKAQLNRR
eukprot:c11526_g1_i3.p1 GENE.c11526_g1_i3~~c11526_g1_i3.p1  ORF type:complete len:146 (-),score=28.00 c11526_g1_i3:51-488(-)